MNRSLRVVGILAIGGVVFLALSFRRASPRLSPRQQPLNQAIASAIAAPVAFAKNHFTGGIGAILTTDPSTGYAKIAQVMAGSPAENAGLQGGDLITKINGIPTKGKLLAQVVDRTRLFSFTSPTHWAIWR